MRYFSTNHHSPKVSFKEAMVKSEATDGGLYMPEKLPVVPRAFLNNIAGMPLTDISFVINSMMFGEDIPSAKLKRICDEISSVSMPMYEIEPGLFVKEVFHGPTQTVKDFGAAFLVNIMQTLHEDYNTQINVLVPTTGYSGAAIAKEFHSVPGTTVFVLYPRGTSKCHLEIINSLGDNIHAIEVNGSIDQCNEMVNKAFEDSELLDDLVHTSANSNNIGYLLPMISVYFHAYAQLAEKVGNPGDICFSIPTGNCGNLLAAYMAKKMGLPVSSLIAACNENAGFHNFLLSGNPSIRNISKKTLAYGMDSSRPGNLPRFMEMCHGSLDELRCDISSDICTDKEIAEVVNDVYGRTGYLLDPHSAVAYKCLKSKLPKGKVGVFMATAHPARSIDVLTKVNNGKLKLPPALHKNYCCRAEAVIAPSYPALKKYLKYFCSPQAIQNRV